MTEQVITTTLNEPTGWAAPSALYIHIPFCPYKCPYCDFVTHIGGNDLIQPYVDAITREISGQAEHFPGHSLETVFFGGGTPSMLSPSQILQILDAVDKSYGIHPGAEISLEANPDAVDETSLRGFRGAGINRLSIGVQSLDPKELKLLGRGHTQAQVADAVSFARQAGFDNVSLDLIYGVPEQSAESWSRTLASAIALDPDHISAYSLIVEPGTPYKRLEDQGRLPLPEDDATADMYLFACDLLTNHGFAHYEISNWSRQGFQARHNLMYWHDEQFFAAGVGAYDYLRPYRTVRVRSVKRYIEAISRGEDAVAQRDFVGPEDEKFETAVMGLRLLGEGINRHAFRLRFSQSLDDRYGPVLDDLRTSGFIEDRGDSVRLREKMALLGNEAWERFLPD